MEKHRNQLNDPKFLKRMERDLIKLEKAERSSKMRTMIRQNQSNKPSRPKFPVKRDIFAELDQIDQINHIVHQDIHDWGRDQNKLRRPPKDDQREWRKLEILRFFGYNFFKELCHCCGGWKNFEWGAQRSPIPQTYSQLKNFLIERGHISDYKEFYRLERYFK